MADTPLTSKTQDTLGRDLFAKNIAKSITSYQMPDSVVFGLYGPWGSGKTSMLNMIFEELNQENSSEIGISFVWFNPWIINDKEQLVKIFFQQFYTQIKGVDFNNCETIRKGLEKFGTALEACSSIPSVGSYLNIGGKFAKWLSIEKSLKEQKSELDAQFRKLNKKIVVFIDDIDRLADNEIQLLFQTIKLIADFPNTIYITAFDREVVENALSSVQKKNGKDYLEKIIQIGVYLPIADCSVIEQYLFTNLDNVIDLAKDMSFDHNHWAELYHKGLRCLFPTIRDVKRYVNSVCIALHLIIGEVNIVDYFGITALWVFFPEIFTELSKSKSALTYYGSYSQNTQDPEKVENQAILEGIIQKADTENQKHVKNILLALFPQIQQYFSNTVYTSDYDKQFAKEKRICSKLFFEKYFLFSTPSGEVSQSELNSVIKLSINPDELLEYFQQNLSTRKFRKIIDGLRLKADTLANDEKLGIITTAVSLVESGVDNHEGIFDIGSDLSLIFLVIDLLELLPLEEQVGVLSSELNKRNMVSAITQIVNYVEGENKNGETRILNQTSIEQLKKDCIHAMCNQIETGRFITMKNPVKLILIINEWESSVNIFQKIEGWIGNDPRRMLSFLRLFIFEQRSQTAGEYNIKTEIAFSFDLLVKILTPQRVKEYIQLIYEKNLQLSEQDTKGFNILQLRLEKA